MFAYTSTMDPMGYIYIYIYTFSQPTNGSPVVPSKRVPQVMKTPPAWLPCPVASDAASGTSRDAARVPPSNWPPWATESWRSLNGCGISGSQGAGPKMVDKMGEFLGFNPPFYGCFMGFNGWLVVWNMFFPYWECHHPNWPIFFRGVETTYQYHWLFF